MTHPINTVDQHTRSIHLSTHPIITFDQPTYQFTLSIHPIHLPPLNFSLLNLPPSHTLSTSSPLTPPVDTPPPSPEQAAVLSLHRGGDRRRGAPCHESLRRVPHARPHPGPRIRNVLGVTTPLQHTSNTTLTHILHTNLIHDYHTPCNAPQIMTSECHRGNHSPSNKYPPHTYP